MTVTATQVYDFRDKPRGYADLLRDLMALLAGEHDLIANAANTAALLYGALPDINWAGCYLLQGDELVLGPFQGKPACVRIAMGHGVCGTVARDRRTLVVSDVHAFAGHIACDAESRSEIVVPLLSGSRLLGVLDIDSPLPARFDAADAAGLEPVAAALVASLTRP
ncbi:MAG: GAF domain-containing protein [Steroidobacteraceae bacterium]